LGDGGFWHNGLVSSVGNAVFNKNDGVQIIIDNGYSAATGGQDNMSSEASNRWRATRNSIERAVQGVGVRWTRTIRNTYDVARMRDTLKEASDDLLFRVGESPQSVRCDAPQSPHHCSREGREWCGTSLGNRQAIHDSTVRDDVMSNMKPYLNIERSAHVPI
jgi:hypothetical protein